MQERQEAQMSGQLTEIKKRSELSCANSFDLGKLVVNEAVFLPAVYEERLEEIAFTYDLRGMKPVEELLREDREKQYQFLINFQRMEAVYQRYRIFLSVDNLYYDENYMPYVKHRDLYKQGEQADMQEYLFLYKSFIGGILGKRYSIEQIQQSGLEILKREKFFKDYSERKDGEELAAALRHQKQLFLAKEQRTKKKVSKIGNMVKTILAIAAPILLAACFAVLMYETQYIIPLRESVIAANEAYISGDYVGCTDSMSGIDVEDMGTSTKYILAVSYAKGESLKRNEIASIIDRLSLYSNEKELEYWIALGRLDMATAQDLAQSLSDDQLLMYAYMKELNQLESDTSISGEEKQARISELESSIKSLGEKYTTEQP